METSFRPIPITILDFLGVLIPGFLWSLLATETYAALEWSAAPAFGPMEAWRRLGGVAAAGGGWIGPLSLVFASLVAGYVLKPVANKIADVLARPFFWLQRDTRRAGWRTLSFPYPSLYETKDFFPKVGEILKTVTGVDGIDQLPGRQPFTAAKRILHATAPTLWEESERMEAEVRMAGSLFLAALYSTGLHLALWWAGYAKGGLWSAFSLLAALALGFGFNTLRVREVGYTYLNLLLAEGMRARFAALAAAQRAGADD